MIRRSGANRPGAAFALSIVLGAGSLTTFIPSAHADEVSPDGKGIAGGALLGAEVVTITESLIGIRNGWAFAIGAGLGAAGGGVGGYFVERSSSNGQGAVYMLAGGMALIIPALVLTLNATRYHPSDSATEDKPPQGIPPANPGSPGGNAVTGPSVEVPLPAPAVVPAPATPAAPGGPSSSATPTPASPADASASRVDVALVDLGFARETSLRLALPVPEVRPMYSVAEQRAYGLPQRTEVRMPVLSLTF